MSFSLFQDTQAFYNGLACQPTKQEEKEKQERKLQMVGSLLESAQIKFEDVAEQKGSMSLKGDAESRNAFRGYAKGLIDDHIDLVQMQLSKRAIATPASSQYNIELSIPRLKDYARNLKLSLNDNVIPIGGTPIIIDGIIREVYGATRENNSPFKKYFVEKSYPVPSINIPIINAFTGKTNMQGAFGKPKNIEKNQQDYIYLFGCQYADAVSWTKADLYQRAATNMSGYGFAESQMIMFGWLEARVNQRKMQNYYDCLTDNFNWSADDGQTWVEVTYNYLPENTFLPPQDEFLGYIDQDGNIYSNPNCDIIGWLQTILSGAYGNSKLWINEFRQNGSFVVNPLIQQLIVENPIYLEKYRTWFANPSFSTNDMQQAFKAFIPQFENIKMEVDDTIETVQVQGDNEQGVLGFPNQKANYICPPQYMFMPFTPRQGNNTYAEISKFPNPMQIVNPNSIPTSSGDFSMIVNTLPYEFMGVGQEYSIIRGFSEMPTIINPQYVAKVKILQEIFAVDGRFYYRDPVTNKQGIVLDHAIGSIIGKQ